MRSRLVSLAVVAACVSAQEADAQEAGSRSPVWSVGLARGLGDGGSSGVPGFERNEQSASLLFEWRRPGNRFGIRLELQRGISDYTWGITDPQAGCSPVSCFSNGQQTTSAALLGASVEFRQGRRLRPYLLFGGGVQNAAFRSQTSFTCAGAGMSECSAIEGAPKEFSLRDFYPVLSGGGGVSLNLGRFSAFGEGRLVARPVGGRYTGSTPPLSIGLRIRPEN
jgi:hypothetical protein